MVQAHRHPQRPQGEGRQHPAFYRREPRWHFPMNTQILEQARQLSVRDQLELVEALWNDIAERNALPPPTPAQLAELDRRLAAHEADPDDVVSWDEVKASAMAQLGR